MSILSLLVLSFAILLLPTDQFQDFLPVCLCEGCICAIDPPGPARCPKHCVCRIDRFRKPIHKDDRIMKPGKPVAVPGTGAKD